MPNVSCVQPQTNTGLIMFRDGRDQDLFLVPWIVVVLCALIPRPAAAATIVINNLDDPGVGLNDPTVVAPVGGNPGTTRGDQRLRVLEQAATIWGAVLDSNVEISVGVRFLPLSCTTTEAVLGNTGTSSVLRDFPRAPHAATWYHSALADKLAGSDLRIGSDDIVSEFNINIDTDPGCLGGVGWYYGFDHAEGVQLDFLAVVLHELGHGLGFANFVNLPVGAFLGLSPPCPCPDIDTLFMYDLAIGKTWDTMANFERVISATNDPNLVWDGPAVTAAIGFLSAGTNGGFVRLHAPNPLWAGSTSHWTPETTPDLLMEPALTSDLTDDLDLTDDFMADIGWVICGDGFVQDGEVCDDGFTDECGTCNATCTGVGTGSTCGDGLLCPEFEACDDGFTDACGTCDATCTGAGAGSVCGDGTVCPETEDCDDGSTHDCGACNATCTAPGTGSVCGDLMFCPETEDCDDGYTDDCGSCDATCTGPGTGWECGDGIVCPEIEACDDGGIDPCGDCNAICTGPGEGICGDGIVCVDTEVCDDGFLDECGDCNATCTGSGTGSACGDGELCPQYEDCDDGFTDGCGTCNATCDGFGTASVCGDGAVCPETEACDDGGDPCGACNVDCTALDTGPCGDGEVCPATEACDDGYADDCGSCNATCTGPGAGSDCGDGLLCAETEACDDGYNDACGTCNATCTAAGDGWVCGDGVVCPETEFCDDGFTDDCGTCSTDCTGSGAGSVCGNGEVCPEFETCDDGSTGDCGPCNSTCTGTGFPCSSPTPLCDEVNSVCVECLLNTDCADDSNFCNGAEICSNDTCVSEGDPCSGATPVCCETPDSCEAECCDATACPAPTDFCDGAAACVGGVCGFTGDPCSGPTPVCCEAADACEEECCSDADCGVGTGWCDGGVCIPCCCLTPEDGHCCQRFGDVVGAGGSPNPGSNCAVDLFDVFCELNGFSAGSSWPTVCPEGDLVGSSATACGGNGTINLFDVFASLNAFAEPSDPACPHPCSPSDACDPVVSSTRLSPAVSARVQDAVSPWVSAGLSVVPSMTRAKPGGFVSIDVYVSGVLELRGYQLAVDAKGGRRGVLALDRIVIETERPDYVFGDGDAVSVTDEAGRRVLCALFSDAVPVSDRRYLATFVFRASTHAAGVFRVAVRVEDTLLGDSVDRAVRLSRASPASIEVERDSSRR